MPVKVVGDTLGYIHMRLKIDDFTEPIRRNLYLRLFSTLLIFSGGLVLAVIISAHYVSPVVRLAHAAETVAAGDLSQELPVEGNDEVGRLTRSFNEMIVRLRQNRALEEAVRENQYLTHLGKLSSGMAHEIRNPLNFIGLAVDHLGAMTEGKGSEGEAEKRQVIGRIKEEIGRLNELVTNFILYGRPPELQRAAVRIPELVVGVLRMAEERLRAQSISCRTEFEDAREIHADPDMLRRALVNLVGNAVDAMPNGGTLSVSAGRRPDGRYSVVVEDTGIGIPAEERERIFEPYFTTKVSGLGLGLVLTKKIVDAHGGEIFVDSTPGERDADRGCASGGAPRGGGAGMKGTVLVVDDERNQREILGAILKSEGYIPLLASGGTEALRILEREAVDLVITDLVMPGMTGEELIDAVLARNPGMPILLSSAYGTIQTAVDAIKKGAYYYFEKPVDRARLLIIVERAIENLHLRESHRVLSEKLFPGAVPILGEHAAIREIKRILPRVARSESTILLTGESGTGKEVIARSVHSMSGRNAAPFLAVNCASLPDTLFESELFGHERGAFTGAVRREIGLFEAAGGGTIFLDEIAEIKLETQAKLLRALQEKEIRRIGGKENIPVDVRIVAATNRDLDDAVREGKFRADLFYRLNIVKLTLPPLRDRISDIPLLSEHFLAKHGEKGVPPVREITKEAMRLLMRYTWPGNIRELSSVVERAVVLAEGGKIGPEELPLELREGADAVPARAFDLPPQGVEFEKVEEHLLRQAVARSGGVHTRGAELLRMSYKAYIYRLKKFGILPPC